MDGAELPKVSSNWSWSKSKTVDWLNLKQLKKWQLVLHCFR